MHRDWAFSPLRNQRVGGANVDALKFPFDSENMAIDFSFKSDASSTKKIAKNYGKIRTPFQNLSHLHNNSSPVFSEESSGASVLGEISGMVDGLSPNVHLSYSLPDHSHDHRDPLHRDEPELSMGLLADNIPRGEHCSDELDFSACLDDDMSTVTEREYMQHRKDSESRFPPTSVNHMLGKDLSSSMDVHDTAQVLDITIDSIHDGHEQLFATDGCQPIAAIPQFMVMVAENEDLFCIDGLGIKAPSPVKGEFSPRGGCSGHATPYSVSEAALTPIVCSDVDVDWSREIGVFSTEMFVPCEIDRNHIHADISMTSASAVPDAEEPMVIERVSSPHPCSVEINVIIDKEEVVDPIPLSMPAKPRMLKVLMAAIFPPKPRRGKTAGWAAIGHSRFRHTMVVAHHQNSTNNKS